MTILADPVDPAAVDRIAHIVADRVFELLKERGAQQDEYIRGTHAIARFLGISTDTLRRRLKDPTIPRLPICGTEPFDHKGKIRLRPICKKTDLAAYRKNPNSELPVE